MNALHDLDNMWCILRVSGPRTLALAESLKEAGFDVWTPVGASSRRRPRKATTEAKPVPVMPTYVFARGVHMYDLIGLAVQPVSPHPQFSVFRWDGRIPLIADRTLDALRRGESRYLRRLREGKPVKAFKQGDKVEMTEGGFAGMSGVVETSKGKFTVVCFPGFTMPIKIATMYLEGDGRQPSDLAA